MTNKAVAFVALSSGRKPSTAAELQSVSGIKKQYGSIVIAANTHKLEIVNTVPDHSTHPNVNWFTRQPLRKAIEKAVKNEQTLIIYDLIKLLSSCPRKDILKWWQYLETLPINIIDATSRRKVSSLSKKEIISLVHYKTQDRRSTGRAIKIGLKSSDHTCVPPSSNARKAAQRARAAQAIAFANSLEETIDRLTIDLTKRKIKPTLQRTADELNIKSITTRRGGQWTATSVKRVKDRLKAINK